VNRRRFVVDRSEAGGSLILAMAMVTLISVALVAALGFATASLHTVSVIGTQRANTYAGDGAVQTAIQALRYNSTAGTTAVGTACPSVSTAAVGAQGAATVTCQVVQTYTPGGPSVPPYAIMAVGANAAEAGISVNAATYGPLDINAPLASNSPAVGTSGVNSVAVSAGTLDLTGYTLDARGTCTGTITVTTPATDKRCSTGTAYPDPGYPSQTLPALTTPNPAPVCAVANGVLQFGPGYYTNTAELETPDYSPGSGPTCATGSLYFQPGVYYFDFGWDPSYTDAIWNVTQHVVGGEYKGWNPNTAASLPPVPSAAAANSNACKTAADGATTGVQFVFGGASQMNVTASGASVELCPDPTPTGTNQQIAIYGEPSGVPVVTNVTEVANAAVQTPTGWTNPLNTLPISPSLTSIDTKYGADPIASGATESLSLNGYTAPVPLIPAAAVNVTAVLKMVHSESVASAATNVSSITAYIGSTTSGCSFAATPHTTTTATVTLATDTISVPQSSACIAALSGTTFSIIYKIVAATGKTFTENLDGIDLVVSYNLPGEHAESGCTIVVNSCPVVDVGGTGGLAKFVTWGTVYTPLGLVNADTNGTSVVGFRRGVVARAVAIPHIPPSQNLSFCLATGWPCAGPPTASSLARALLFTATVGGLVQIRALVQYFDTPALGTTAKILSWNVVRGGS
jgi:hypothetical protein